MKQLLVFSLIVVIGAGYPLQAARAEPDTTDAPSSVVLPKGQPAPFTGILLTNDRANKARVAEEELKQHKLINESLDRSIKLYQERDTIKDGQVNVLLQQNQVLMKDKGTTDLERFGYIFLGVAATIGAGFVIKKVSQ